jgi:hypothetical protein
LAAPSNTAGGGTNLITTANPESIAAGANSTESNTGTGHPASFNISTLGTSGASTGQGSLGIIYTTTPAYLIFAWYYMGTGSHTYTLDATVNLSDTTSDSAVLYYIRNVTGGVGISIYTTCKV